MPILSKESKNQILSGSHLKTEVVQVPEWGADVAVIVSEMSGLTRDLWRRGGESTSKKEVSESFAELIAATVVDESGALVFDAGDIAQIRALGSDVLDRIAGVAIRINGLHASAVEEAAKNSAAAPSGVSGSSSPATSESR